MVISRISAISKGARRAPQDTKILFAVLPVTECQGLFNQIHKKVTTSGFGSAPRF